VQRVGWLLVLVVLIGILVGCAQQEGRSLQSNPEIGETEEETEVMLTEEGVKYVVDPQKLVGGGPPKDGIPSIDNPRFVSVDEADEWIQDNELALALVYKGVERVYPLQVLVSHEIVNDVVAGDPLLVTYCPLCGSGIAYDRRIDGEEVEFGVSGKLYNSNLVMYDRRTDTYWTQIEGRAIVGELAGMRLAPISVDTVVWRDWKKTHPESEVLSRETGFTKPYGVDPYGSYYENSFIPYPVEGRNDIIHPKTAVFGVEVNGSYKAYREDDLAELGTIEDVVGGAGIRLVRDESGIVKVTNLETGEEIVKERGFWFAWYAFHPYTELYTAEG